MKLSTALRRAAEFALEWDRHGYLESLMPVWDDWMSIYHDYLYAPGQYCDADESCLALLLLAVIAEGEGR